MPSEFRRNVLSGIKWNAIGQAGRQSVTFFLMIILSRILMPEEFGQIGILFVFIGIAEVFIDSGLNVALIQKKENTLLDYSTVFVFNVSIGIFIYLIMFSLAPLISIFFNQPELTELTRITSLIFVINSCGSVQNTILMIELNFKTQNLISIIGLISSACVSLYMALNGYGIYSLVGQSLTMALVTNTLLWYFSSWRPQLIFDRFVFRSLFKLGSKVLASSILDRIFTTVDNLIVGKFFNTAQLGYYTRAKSTRDLPVMNTTGIISSMFFPVFTKITDDEELRRYHLKFLGIIAYLIFPLMAGLFVVSAPLTLIIFTDKWEQSIPMLQIFCLYGPIYPMSVILVQSILIRGHAKTFLYLDILKKVILLTGMLIGINFGVLGFLLAVCISNYLGFFLNIIFTSKTLSIQLTNYLKCLLPSILLSIVMALSVYLIGLFHYLSLLQQLIAQIGSGVIIYFILSKVFKISELQAIFDIIFKRKQQE